jgi:large subunit ribosomal protein L25
MKTVAMFGYKRNDLGKAATKAVRAAGKVPCVLYGGKEHIHFTMYESDFKLLVYTPNTYKVQLDIDGSVFKAVLKDIQYHPVNDSIIHADFMELDEAKQIDILIPVKCVGNSIGVRQGGKLMVKQQKLKVKESKISQYLEGGDSSESDSSIAASNSQKSNEDGTFSNLINSLKKTSLVKRKVSSA